MTIKQKLDILTEKGLEAIKFSGVAFLISFLGAFAGSEGTSKNWRRMGIPVVFLICAICKFFFSFWVFTIAVQHLFFRLGWGTPSFVPGYEDEGSTLGKLFYKVFKGNEFFTNVFTRGTVGTMLALTFIGIPFITGNWFEYAYCSLGIILSFALIAWRNLGEYTFTIKGKKYYCCRSDVLVFGILGIAGLKIIF